MSKLTLDGSIRDVGVGVAKGRFLSPGDEVTLSSPLLGTFRNPVRAAQP